MILVIGEMCSVFSPVGNGLYERRFSGVGYEWAKRLDDCFFLTSLSADNAGTEMRSVLEETGMKGAFIPSSLPSSVIAGKDCYYRGTAPFSLSCEEMVLAVAGQSFASAVVSSVILSFNPSASAVLDLLSFMSPQPRIAIDTSHNASGGENMRAKTIGEFRAAFPSLLVSDDADEILQFVR